MSSSEYGFGIPVGSRSIRASSDGGSLSSDSGIDYVVSIARNSPLLELGEDILSDARAI